jgi:hypothetical protein
VCASRNGQEYDLADAFAIEDHPNGTLDWAPVVEDGKSWSPNVTVDVGSPVINLHMAETKVMNQLPEPNVFVTNDVRTPEIKVSVPETVVNVTTPEVTVHPPVVNVASPTVNVPEQKAPIVNVKATPPDVTVNMVPELKITSMPDRVTSRRVERDNQGRITTTTDVEVDA